MIIPAYNEAENIKGVLDSLKQAPVETDYVVVNDCSTDNTVDILKEYGANYLSLPINLGIGGCVQSGYRFALEQGYDIAVQMDGDGQHDPQFLDKVIAPIVSGQADLVIGSRFLEKEGFQSSALRRLGIKWLSRLIRLCCGKRVFDITSGFRAASKQVIAFFADHYAQDFPEPEAIMASVLEGFRVEEVPVRMNERTGGQSSIGGFKSLYYMIKVTISLLIYRIGIKKKKVMS